MAKAPGSNKKMNGLIAKAGKRRPPHIKSKRDRHGKRQWEAA